MPSPAALHIVATATTSDPAQIAALLDAAGLPEDAALLRSIFARTIAHALLAPPTP